MAQTTVDYELMGNQAKDMRACGRQLNVELAKAYSSLEQMHANWYGKRYNSLVMAFNEMIPHLNEMLTLVVTDIPFALATAANNYSLADQGQKTTTASEEAPNKIKNITLVTDVGMRFITASVETTRNDISLNFINVKDQMNKMKSIYSEIKWEGGAADKFRGKFITLQGQIVASIDNINTQFVKLMKQAQEDMERTERKNTIN